MIPTEVSAEKEKRPGSEPRGNTLRVYLYVLKHGPCGLRDVQHGLELASASLASYHLNRLIEGGYVKEDQMGRYVPAMDVTPELLSGYSKLGTTIVPQSFFFSLLLSILIAFFGLEALFHPTFTSYLVVAALGAVAALWYDTAILWRRLTSWK